MTTHKERAAARKKVLASLRKKTPIPRIAKNTGYSPAYIRQLAKANDIEIVRSPHNDTSPHTLNIIAAILKLGANKHGTLSEVARQFKVSRQRVQQIHQQAKAAGIFDHLAAAR